MPCVAPGKVVRLVYGRLVHGAEVCCAERVRTEASYRNERTSAIASIAERGIDVVFFAFHVVQRCRPHTGSTTAAIAEDGERRLHGALETEELIPRMIAIVAALANTINRTGILPNTRSRLVFITPHVFVNLILLRFVHGRITTRAKEVSSQAARRDERAIA